MDRYEISPRANADIDAIWKLIAKDDPEAADRVEGRIHAAVKLLAQMPDIGHRRGDVLDPRYRFWIVGRYAVAYRLEAGVLIVVRVIHGSRDIRSMFE